MKSLTRWDPFRTMQRWDPIDEIRSMQHEMDLLFNRFLGRDVTAENAGSGRLPLKATPETTTSCSRPSFPGLIPRTLMSVTDRELVIRGERKAEKVKVRSRCGSMVTRGNTLVSPITPWINAAAMAPSAGTLQQDVPHLMPPYSYCMVMVARSGACQYTCVWCESKDGR